MERIAGTGMNALELEQNAQLSESTPRNLNVDTSLPCAHSANRRSHATGTRRAS